MSDDDVFVVKMWLTTAGLLAMAALLAWATACSGTTKRKVQPTVDRLCVVALDACSRLKPTDPRVAHDVCAMTVQTCALVATPAAVDGGGR